MDLKLQGARALVTGASQGLGRAIALGLAAEGADVAICARNRTRLELVADEVSALGSRCISIPGDLADPDTCDRVVEEAAAAFEGLDILINNVSASVDTVPKSLELATDDQLLARVRGKTLPAIRCSRAAWRYMRKAGSGRIVCIGGSASRSVTRQIDSLTRDAGVVQGLGNAALATFAKYLAEEVAHEGIVVNVVQPHVVRTGRHIERMNRLAAELGVNIEEAERQYTRQFPIGRMVETSDIVPLVMLLASKLSGATTGQNIGIDGGALHTILY